MSGRIQRQDVKTASELLALGAQKSDLINDDQIYISGLPGDNTFAEAIALGLLRSHTPLYLKAAATPDATVVVVANVNQLPDGTAEVNGTALPAVAQVANATLNFQTGGTTGATFEVALPTTTLGSFRRAVFSLRSNGTIAVVFTPSALALVGLANAGAYFVAGAHPIGWIDLESIGGQSYKTAGSLTNIIENKVGGVSRIFNLVGSTGVAHASGTRVEAAAFTRWLSPTLFKLSEVLTHIDTQALRIDSGTPAANKVAVINDATGKSLRVTDMTIDENGNVVIPGDLIVQGSRVIQNTETVLIEDNILVLNNGESGSGVSAKFAGIRINRGSLLPYVFIFDELKETFRVGQQSWVEGTAQAASSTTITLESSLNYQLPTSFNGCYLHIVAGTGAGQVRTVPSAGNNWNDTTKVLTVSTPWVTIPDATSEYELRLADATQAVATRQDSPTSFGVPFWSASDYQFSTVSLFTYDPVNFKLSVPNLTISGTVVLDTINENTANVGVTIDGVLLKDGAAQNAGFYGAAPLEVSSSTSGSAGSANTASRSDHSHNLGIHGHNDATDGGVIIKMGTTGGSDMNTAHGFARIISPTQTAIAAGDYTFDCSVKHVFLKIGGTGTFTLSNMSEGQTVNIVVESTGSVYTITWAGEIFRWGVFGIPSPSIDADKFDVYTFFKVGGVVYGAAVVSMS